jgi:hypothetical protein
MHTGIGYRNRHAAFLELVIVHTQGLRRRRLARGQYDSLNNAAGLTSCSNSINAYPFALPSASVAIRISRIAPNYPN